MNTTTSTQILHHTNTFTAIILSQSELRRRLISTLHRHETPISSQTNLKHINLAADTLENAISVSSATIRSSSVSLAEKLLLPLPGNPVSFFLLSLIYTLSNRRTDAALSLLRIFYSNPSLARSEIAPVLYEKLFSVHLLPVFQWFDEQRTKILSPSPTSRSSSLGACDDSMEQSVVLPYTKLLSQMSEGQASELRELEKEYEYVLDDNCRIAAGYFIEVLLDKNGNLPIRPPSLILSSIVKGDKMENNQLEIAETEMPTLKNGRYNPIWAERETSVELLSRSFSSKSLGSSYYPQRVSPKFFRHQQSSEKLITPADLKTESTPGENSPCSSSESEAESKEEDKMMALLKPRRSQTPKKMHTTSAKSRGSQDYPMADYGTPPHGNGKHTPPKDFVCPITSNLFDDPVTLETGQTYERKAIEEWLNRGNSTCPITRHKLQNTQLPKTNYVLKRLIASWKEQNPVPVPAQAENSYAETELASQSENPYTDAEPELVKSIMPSTSPNSVITQATVGGVVSELRHAINNLYMSEVLEESEMAVLQIEQFWKEVNLGVDIKSMLSKPPIINGFMEILFNSVDPQVLQATVFLLAELGSRDDAVIQTLVRVDNDVECIIALFIKGLMEAVVLIYLLRPSTTTLVEMAILNPLITVLNKKEEDLVNMCIKPKTAAVLLLAQILGSGEERIASSVVKTLISEKAIGSIVSSLGAELVEERIAAVEILLRCMYEDGTCRNTIVDKAELSPVLESFIGATDEERSKIVRFFSELVKLNRRTFNEQILHVLKEGGAFSTMHTLLIFLQTAPEEQRPVVAGLLLQLDLLVEPRKMSIYREEAMDALVSCLRSTDFPAAQVAAAETILSLQGRFSHTGNPLTREVLLKRAGFGKSYISFFQVDQISNFSGEFEITPVEEKASDDWERKIASVLVSHEFGLLFEALADGLKSRIAELCSPCFLSAIWLIYMLTILPDTGIQGAARVCLLKRFISIFKSANDTEDRVLSMLALNSFLHFPDGLIDLTSYTKDILKGLRELKRSFPMASDMLKVLLEGSNIKADIWIHKELIQVDCSENGEVLSLICLKDKIFSGHSDGTIKVWTVKGNSFHLMQETQEHVKAVTSLAISESGDKLFSGSLDRTIRVWSVGKAAIHCVQLLDMKDHIHNLVVANSMYCFIPQGTGVKVQSWSGESRLLNSNKHVKCLAFTHGKLYCGCHDNSIQEIDMATGAVNTIQSGSKKLLGKANPINAMQIRGIFIYAASSPLDGASVKIWSTSNYSMVGALPTTLEVRAMAMSSELIYLGGRAGSAEIWDRKKQNRVDTLQTGTNCKIQCMALDGNEEILIIGTSDGRVQAWEIN